MEEFGVDELARRGGTTVRQVRLYVERGLLPKARRQGRAARYDQSHVHRLQMILRLVARGHTLATIKELTAAWDGQRGLGHVLGLEDVVTQPFAEAGRPVDREEIAAQFPDADVDEMISRAIDLGLLERADGDAYVLPIPALFDVGAELVAAGVPITAVLDLAAQTNAAAADLADRFVATFLEHVWRPFDDAGRPPEALPRIIDTIAQQRVAARRVVVAALDAAMQERVDAAAVTTIASSAHLEEA